VTRPAGERYTRALRIYRETSGEAWASVLASLGEIDRRILSYVRDRRGATTDECMNALGMVHQTASAQLSHMAASGLVVDSGARRPTRSGRAAIVWVLPAVATRELQASLFS